ncbi:UTP--glucose-1-phosphate uridylyltransferase family protein [Trichomonas vaginalis G3]|uniref:UTP--glucose-1-phosphate uridylyltransferase n=1 Tax=Trichomonas vaginalis (strain ATCC PRA-98 / G3) TaxID=412133 RepID=A2DYG1_TRIV3|nr:UTP--glucose-1-phosphate uridylyltransferase family [Trichomonas vaginalis G3]EAY14496.1 UTP--glucose-1-phosphate uridylyltransferase family protein [Trichomonas vaginalis G3]KAI5529331.1 UTP--glucose-1-phosphate uridylyltransferase family [Trichomonas vaginalis G3]|eukprot:XP_001326719.1 UTP--glucose-1-phosphate uridylyltransferase family protein [Trichomonas vaginalis G3]
MSVASLMATDEKAALQLLREKVAPLKLSKGAEDKLVSMFKAAFSKDSEAEINWDFVKPLTPNEQFPYENLAEPANPAELLKQLVVVKLNGGLGTTMGCTFPKSLINVADNETFFDITAQQVAEFNQKYNVDIPLVLMHSFYTDDLMKPHLNKVKGVRVLTFNQNKFPRIDAETLEPVPTSPDSPLAEWNPPGHGDVYHCLRDSGLLDQLIAEGKKFMFISNIDNLGARIDLKILNKVATENRSYAAETVPKTPDDWKGGMPILYKGRVKLLETAQVPNGHMDDFKNIKIFDIFNSNNMWVNLVTLKKALDEDTLVLDVIKNRKVYNGRNVIQLEAAAGSAIQSFHDSISIKIPRSRFLPVKSCNELLMDRSDLYVRNGGEFILSPKRTLTTLPSINLGPKYQHVSEFEKRFKAIPSLLNVDVLEVTGDVTFGPGVVIEGKVHIKGSDDKPVTIENRHLKDETVTF